jgi:magnesium transporter
MIRGMGVYRDGVAVPVPSFSDVIWDEPTVRAPRQALREARAAVAGHQDAFVWVGLFEPTKAELAVVQDVFDLDPLAVEDAGNPRQRPKLELAKGDGLLVLRHLLFDPRTSQVESLQEAVFVGADYAVTVRQGSARELRTMRAELLADPDRLRLGPWAVLHAVLDGEADGYLRIADEVASDVQEIEELVFSPRHRDLSERIYLLKRENLEVRRAVVPLLSLGQLTSDDRLPGVPDRVRPLLRDVGDHLQRVADQTESVDSLLLTLMGAATQRTDLQQNADMRRIASWAALLAIPTAIAGIYGMNFAWLPIAEQDWGFVVVMLLMGVACLLAYRALRRSGWL